MDQELLWCLGIVKLVFHTVMLHCGSFYALIAIERWIDTHGEPFTAPFSLV